MSHPRISHDVFKHALELKQGSRVQAEYLWLDAKRLLRCKTRTLEAPVKSLADLPVWNFDGSSTGQAEGKDSEVFLQPVKFYPDPFRRGDNVLVLCECLDPNMKPVPTNTRAAARQVFDNPKVHAEKPWWGLEQEYTLYEADNRTPLGWPENGFPPPQGPYYCGVGTDSAFGRRIVEAHYRACLYAGITISGVNAEVMPGQWEFQVGPCVGIDGADQLVMARYLLTRVCEEFGMNVSLNPKPVNGDWNGAGCHTNFSTDSMRKDGGIQKINEAIKLLEAKHMEHVRLYGEDNHLRLTGHHETAPIDRFSYGVANRGASIRIPRMAVQDGKGYFEDRRPAANMDPYLVTAKICHTVFQLTPTEAPHPFLNMPAITTIHRGGTYARLDYNQASSQSGAGNEPSGVVSGSKGWKKVGLGALVTIAAVGAGAFAFTKLRAK